MSPWSPPSPPPNSIPARPHRTAAASAPPTSTGAMLVFAATDDRAVNHRIGIAAKGRGVFANIADSADECDFVVPARLTRGEVQIAISTGGRSPRLSADLRRKLESVLR